MTTPNTLKQHPVTCEPLTSRQGLLSSLETHSLRLDSDPDDLRGVNLNVSEILATFNRIASGGCSEALITVPLSFETLATVHGFACLQRLSVCDQQKLTTLLFPWNRNSSARLRDILVDRDSLCDSVRGPLGRINARANQPWAKYVLALQSLRSVLDHNKRNIKLREAVTNDHALEHPTMFELMPQVGIHAGGSQKYEAKFLERLKRYTWLKPTSANKMAVDFVTTPFFLVGVGHDAVTVKALRAGGLDAKPGGRRPNILMLDLTDKRRRSLEHRWKEQVQSLLDSLIEIYVEEAPPVLAITDDVYMLQELRHGILKEYDELRSDNFSARRNPAPSHVILNFGKSEFSAPVVLPSHTPKVSVEVFGTDGLRAVEGGLQLRRQLIREGEMELADAIASACRTLQRILTLPGEPQQFSEFIHSRYEGFALQSQGARYDHLSARAALSSLLEHGGGGVRQIAIEQFLNTFSSVILSIEKQHPGRRRFDQCIRRVIDKKQTAIVVMPNKTALDFAKWRVDNDPFLFDLRMAAERFTLIDREGAVEVLREGRASDRSMNVVFIEPSFETLLLVVAQTRPEHEIVIIFNHTSAEQLCRRLHVLNGLEGIGAVASTLTPIEAQGRSASSSHISDIGDLDSEVRAVQHSIVDYTDRYSGSASGGPPRVLILSGGDRIKVFDGSEIPVYESDASYPWSKAFAKDIRVGDEICLFRTDLVESARAILKLSARAPDFLAKYHTTVASAAAKLPGEDLNGRVLALRERILQLNANADLPAIQMIRRWIEVEELAHVPRDEVRPHAPRTKENYDLLMRALGVGDLLANILWEEGVFGTRSVRIKTGAFFHQLLMAVLIDPDGVGSRLPQLDSIDLWKVNQVAEGYVETVVANEAIQ